MIKEIIITDNKDLPIKYWKQVKALNRKKKFEFKEGLNLIIGPNGSGKSTLLKLITKTFHCEKYYHSTINMGSIDEMTRQFSFSGDNKIDYIGYNIIHDGAPIFNFDSSDDLTNQESFEKYGLESLDEIFTKRKKSTGQNIISRMNSLFNKISTVNEVMITIDKNRINDIWRKKFDASTKIILNPQLERFCKTIIFDEPTSNFDIIHETLFWNETVVPLIKNGFQIIIATHSLGVLKKFDCEVNVIELEKGYMQQMKKCFKQLFE